MSIKSLLEELIPRDFLETTKKFDTLLNNRETWSRIGSGDKFGELGSDFDLDEWIEENDYDLIAD